MPRVIGLLLVFALCAAVLGDPIYLSIRRYVDTPGLFDTFVAAANESDVINVRETNQNNEIYTFAMQIGTPGQRLIFTFDLDTSETSVVGDTCKTSYCKESGVVLFRPKKSSTFRTQSNTTSMMIGSDTFTLGSTKVVDHTFAVFSDASFPSGYSISGKIGLGLSQFSRLGTPTLFEDMISQGAISQAVFSIYLDPTPMSNKSVVVLGGVDHSLHVGHIHYRPLTSNRVWATRLVSITLDAVRVHYCQHPCRAIFSTTRPFIYGPDVHVRKINNALNISSTCDNYFQLPRLVFHLGPHYLSIPPSSYVSMIKGKCKSLLTEGGPFLKQNWILGNLFLRSYYTIFDLDNRRIGWAPLTPTIISSKK